jgi:hypothetical protein
MRASDSNPMPEALAFSVQYSSVGKGKGMGEIERCSHCKRDGHSQEKCWILHPHLRPNKNTSEAARRRFPKKSLDGREGEKMKGTGLMSAKNDLKENKSSRNEEDMLDRFEMMLSALINHNLGSGSINSFVNFHLASPLSPTVLGSVKRASKGPKCEKK